MNVDLHALQTACAKDVTSGAGSVRMILATACACAVFLSALFVTGSPLLAQDTGAPPKVKTAKPKAGAKPKEGEDGEVKKVAAPVARDPAQAQRTYESGVKLLQAGKAEPAIQSFSAVISGGNLPPQLMAKALHKRGAAYRIAGKPAQAISDLTSALWLKGGLDEADRADAVQQRSAAYREAGLPDQSDPGDAKGVARRTTASALTTSAASAATTPVTTSSLVPETSGTTAPATLFGNLFGFGQSPRPQAAAPPPPPAQAPQPATSAWSSSTTAGTSTLPGATGKTRIAAAVTPPQPATQPAAPAVAAKAAPDGGSHARMILKSEVEADTLAGRLISDFRSHLAGRTPEVSKAQFGAMGTFFQVRVGPYKTKAEAQAFCSRIKSVGADCVAVNE